MIDWNKPVQTTTYKSPVKRLARLSDGDFRNVIEYHDKISKEIRCILCNDLGDMPYATNFVQNVPAPEKWVNVYVRCGAPWLGDVYNSFEQAKRERAMDDLEIQFVQTIKLP